MNSQNMMLQVEQFSKGSPEYIAKNLFYIMTCIATFTCVIRSDFNFAFGLLGYYMIKTTNINKMQRTAQTVSCFPPPYKKSTSNMIVHSLSTSPTLDICTQSSQLFPNHCLPSAFFPSCSSSRLC